MLYRESPVHLCSSMASVEVCLPFIVSLLWESLESSCAAAWAPLSGYLGCRVLSSSPFPRPPPLKEASLCARRAICSIRVELDEVINSYLHAS